MILTERNEPDIILIKNSVSGNVSVGSKVFQEFTSSLLNMVGEVVEFDPISKYCTIRLYDLSKVKHEIRNILKKRKQTTAKWNFLLYHNGKLCLSFCVNTYDPD